VSIFQTKKKLEKIITTGTQLYFKKESECFYLYYHNIWNLFIYSISQISLMAKGFGS